MIKRMGGIALVFLFAFALLAGCGASKKSETANKSSVMDMAEAKADKKPAGEPGSTASEAKASQKQEAPKQSAQEMDKAGNGATSIVQTGSSGQSAANAILAQRKIIRNANVTVEVDDFDVSYGKIKTLIEGFGFVQETNIKKEKIYVDNKEKLITRGIIIIRIDKDKFDSVMDGIKGLGLLIEQNSKSDDITDKFFDTESRLRLLRFEENRLEQFLQRQTEPKVIFDTESRLTEIRHEIESLTGTLKKWSDLVQLSTITINMSEKSVGSNIPVVRNNSYWSRLSGGFVDSIKGVAKFCGEIVIFLAQALPVLVLLAILGFIGLLFYRRFVKGSAKETTKGHNNNPQV